MPATVKPSLDKAIKALPENSLFRKALEDFQALKFYLTAKEYAYFQSQILDLISGINSTYTEARKKEINKFVLEGLQIIRAKNIPENTVITLGILMTVTALFVSAALFLTPAIPFIIAACCLAFTTGLAGYSFYNQAKLPDALIEIGNIMKPKQEAQEDLSSLPKLIFGS